MFNLNFKIFNGTMFLSSLCYITFIFTPIYDLLSISASTVYFLYFILGYLIYYMITIIKLFDYDLVTAKISVFIEFLQDIFENKAKVLKKIQNFYNEIGSFFSFFINFFFAAFFLFFQKVRHFSGSNFNFFNFFVFFNSFSINNQFLYEKSFLFRELNGR